MTSFQKANQLIFIFFILNQFNQLISSTLLTLKSSNSHLNLNQIIHTADFNRTELNLSFEYKPLNKRFVLISGILDVQSSSRELNELLKFLLMIDHSEKPNLIINKLSESSRENFVAKYFRLELNETKAIEQELNLMKYDAKTRDAETKEGHRNINVDKDKNLIEHKNEIKELINDQDDSINKLLKPHLIQLRNSYQKQKSFASNEKNQEEEKTNNGPFNENNWCLLSVLISGDQFRITHLPYSSCLESVCVQYNVVYRLVNRDDDNFKDDKSKENNEKNVSNIDQFLELNQLVIGKECSELDSSLSINLINKPKNYSTPNQNDIKQLNETEDSHSNSKIHDNIVTQNSQKSNQKYPGLIGCLNDIKLNGHLLGFDKLKSSISSKEAFLSSETNFSLFDHFTSSTDESNTKKLQERINLETNGKLIHKIFRNTLEKAAKNDNEKDDQELNKKFDRKQDKNFDKEDVEQDKEIKNNTKDVNRNDMGSISINNVENFIMKNISKDNQENSKEEEEDSGEESEEKSDADLELNIEEFIDKSVKETEKEVENEEDQANLNWWNNVELLNNSLIGKIDLDICNRSDPCKNFCLHNASCTLNEDGEPFCHCDKVGYTGQRCFFPLYKKNCKELELLGFRSNGQYIVDSDGIGPYPPSHVYCKFREKEDTKTLIHHNLKDETIVRSDKLTRPFLLKLKYRDFPQEILADYVSKFRICKQEIRFDCHHARFGFGDYAWFVKLSSNGLLNIVEDKMLNYSQNDHLPNKACSLTEDIWNYEEMTVLEPIVETYFLPLSTCLSDHQQSCHRNGFWRRFSNKIWPHANSTKIRPKQLKAKAGKRKFKPEARLSISPLECTGLKHPSHEVSFATEASYIEIHYKDLIDTSSMSYVKNEENFFPIKHISFNFRTLQTKPGILIHISLQPGDQLYFEIMLKNEYELEFAYPFNGKMKSMKLKSIQRLNTGVWQMISVFFNDQEMRISVNTVSLLFNFDAKSMFDRFNSTMFVGGVARIIGNRKSKIGFIGCFKELIFGDDQSTINLKEFIHPKLVKQILPTCKRICTKNPCENKGVCIEHWSFRRCVCKNKFAHIGFNCELNLNKNSITIMSGKSFIHLVLNRNFNKFLQNELNEFVNQNTINTLIELNAKQLADKGKLKTDSDSLNQVNVKGVKNLHLSEEKRWNELLLMNKNFSENYLNYLNNYLHSKNSLMNDSLNNQTFSRLIEQQPAGLGLDKWDALDKGKLKMTLQFAFRTRVDSGLLFYANDNLNNFIQLHFVDKKRLCLTFNVVEKIMRIEIILEDGILNSGDPIQLRVKRYLEYTVFHVLIYLKEHNKYEQKSIYVKIPCEFLTIYSHKPFKLNNDFDFFYILESELTYKFVNFEDESNDEVIKGDEGLSYVDTLNKTITIDKNDLTLERKSNGLKDGSVADEQVKNSHLKRINSKLLNSTKANSIIRPSINDLNMVNSITSNSSSTLINKQQTINSTSQNKFTEQVIPVRGYYKLQVFPSHIKILEMTDNAESYDGLINNLDKLIEDENDFFKPLNLIYLANLNNFDSYFGLNHTFNTSTSSLTKNIVQSIATNLLQKNNKTTATNYVPLLTVLNTTISKINLINTLNDSLQNSIQNTLKNSIEKGLDQNDTQINILQMQLNSTFNNTLSGSIEYALKNLTDPSNQTNESVSKDVKTNLNATLNLKNYTQIYIGNVDGNDTLSSLPGFVGAISGIIFNNQLINLTKITEKRYKDELDNGKILTGIKMLCETFNCQNSGKCLDNWLTNKTICNCTNTSYTGEKCDEDLGSSFNYYNHLFYRLDARKPRNLLEDQVIFELAFNFNYDEYLFEKNKYYHQETDESNLHKHNKLYNSDPDQAYKYKLNFDNRILLLIIYETRYINLYINKDNSLILSDVDNKGNELNLKIENNINNTFFDEYRHYIRYNRKEQIVLLDDKSFQVNFYKDVVKHFYLPNQANYGIYIAGKPKKDKRFNNWNGFHGSICNVKVILNGQTFEPFNNAFNAVNMSLIQIKGSIRQTRCAGFNKAESKENSFLPYRKKELLNQYLKWNTPKAEFIEFEHSLFTQFDDSILFYSIGFVILVICFLLPISVYIGFSTLKIRNKKLLQDARFNRKKVLIKRKKGKKSKSLDSVYQGEIRLLR